MRNISAVFKANLQLYLALLLMSVATCQVSAQTLESFISADLALRNCRTIAPLPSLQQSGIGAILASKPATIPEVRFIYLVPSDRAVNANYAMAIANAARDLQRFYQQQLGNTKTFNLRSPIVETIRTAHTAIWYQTNPNGATFVQFYNNTLQDAAAGVGGFNTSSYIYAVYIDSESTCGQCGGCGGGGALVVGSGDLKGLVGLPTVRSCPTDPAPIQYPPCRYVGGLGHELGHAFGLPHPPNCEQTTSACDAGDIMWTGLYAYPATYINASERAILNGSTFFVTQAPVIGPTSCNNLLSTKAQSVSMQVTLSPNPAHDVVTLRLASSLPIRMTAIVLDVLGREVKEYSIAAGVSETSFDVQRLPKGLYIIRLANTSQKMLLE